MGDTPSSLPQGTVALNVAATALLAWLYAGEIADGVRARSAEVSALAIAPNITFSGIALLAALVAACFTAFGVLRRRDGTWKGYRLVPVAAVLILFVDLLVLSGNHVPMGAPDRVAIAIQALAHRASEASTPQAVLARRESLEELVRDLGPPPMLVRGLPLKGWALALRTGCLGPSTDAGAEAPGTLVYCVAPDAQHAWVTAVAFPREQRFGSPAVFSSGGEALSAEVFPAMDPGEASGEDGEGEGVVLDDDGGVLRLP